MGLSLGSLDPYEDEGKLWIMPPWIGEARLQWVAEILATYVRTVEAVR